MITPKHLIEFFGPERLALLTAMPVIREGAGLEAHLQAACKEAPTLSAAVVKCLRNAGSAATPADLVRASELDAAMAGTREAEAGDAAGELTQSSSETERIPTQDRMAKRSDVKTRRAVK